eukprot:1178725-Prorocentrum_minimum.AAC.2
MKFVPALRRMMTIRSERSSFAAPWFRGSFHGSFRSSDSLSSEASLPQLEATMGSIEESATDAQRTEDLELTDEKFEARIRKQLATESTLLVSPSMIRKHEFKNMTKQVRIPILESRLHSNLDSVVFPRGALATRVLEVVTGLPARARWTIVLTRKSDMAPTRQWSRQKQTSGRTPKEQQKSLLSKESDIRSERTWPSRLRGAETLACARHDDPLTEALGSQFELEIPALPVALGGTSATFGPVHVKGT